MAQGGGTVAFIPYIYGALLLLMMLGVGREFLVFCLIVVTGGALYLVQSRLTAAQRRVAELEALVLRLDGIVGTPAPDTVEASPSDAARSARRAAPMAAPSPAPSPPRASAPQQAPADATSSVRPGSPSLDGGGVAGDVAPARAATQDTGPDARPGPTPGPSPLDLLVGKLRAWLSGGNPLVRIGATLLLIGVAFLVNYLSDRGVLPPAVRLSLIMAGGVIVLGLGWKLRAREGAYGLVLQGAGVAVLYLSIFGGLRLYGLLSPTLAFSALIIIAILASALAIIQNAAPLALFATVGGFLAPILTSTGSGSHVALFSYYAVLDLGILAMAWYRAWRLINWVGFVFTFGVGAVWGLLEYRDAWYVSAQSFLVFFVLLYLAVPILFARRQPPQLRGLVDASLVFGVPTIAFLMQVGLVHDTEFGVALSALATAAVYTGLATLLWRRGGAPYALLARTHVALAVTFATLALPFALDDSRITGATWALEGAGLVWIGVRQGARLPQFAGVALQGLGAIAVLFFLLGGVDRPLDAIPWLNGHFLSLLMLGIGGLACSYFLEARDAKKFGALPLGLLIWGALWWGGAGLQEAAVAFEGTPWASPLQGLWIGASAWLFALLAGRLDGGWRGARALIITAVPTQIALIALAFGAEIADGIWRSLAMPGWPLALAATWLGLRTLAPAGASILNLAHVGVVVIMALLGSWALWDLVAPLTPDDSAWRWAPWGLAPALLALLLARRFPGTALADSFSAWTLEGPRTLLAWALGWSLLSIAVAGDARPLPFVPLLNPLELVQWLGVCAAVWLALRDRPPAWRVQLLAAMTVGFAVLTAMVPRAVHHYAGVAWDADRLFASGAVQTSVSVLWTIVAGAAMVVGNRGRTRLPWMAGAVLLGVVVVKLFLVDLAESGNLMRILSFLSVGGLVLVIGYFAPLPPNVDPEAEADPEDAAAS